MTLAPLGASEEELALVLQAMRALKEAEALQEQSAAPVARK